MASLLLWRLLPLVTVPFGPTDETLDLATVAPHRVLVPAGTFRMGSSPEDLSFAVRMCLDEGGGAPCVAATFQDESPVRWVRLAAYRIDRTEVTRAAYMRCVRAGACLPPALGSDDPRFAGPRVPIVGVTVSEARVYCRWAGGRLPTEAEWERAARGADGRRFPWGNAWNPHLCNHGQVGELRMREFDGHRIVAAVGTFPNGRSPLGLDDMAGNVLEWVDDRYGEYLGAQVFGPRGPTEGPGWVVRGGSWRTPGVMTRTTMRQQRLGTARQPDLGFRCAQTVPL